MTQDEHRALIESVLDGMVEEGIFRVVGIDHLGRKRYVLTAAAKRPLALLLFDPKDSIVKTREQPVALRKFGVLTAWFGSALGLGRVETLGQTSEVE